MTYDREELLATLADASPALSRSSIIDAYKNLWFDTQYVYAFGGGLGMRLPLKTDLECGLPGLMLMDLLKASSLKEVFIDKVKGEVVLQNGKSKITLATADADPFFDKIWKFPNPGKKDKQFPLSEAFVEMLNQVNQFRGSGDQSLHWGATVIPTKSAFELYSTNGKFLAQAVVKEKPPADLEPFIMPWDFIERVLNLIEPGNNLHVLSDCLLVEANGVRICSTLLQMNDKPNLSAAIDSHVDDRDPIVLPPTLKLVLEYARILAKNEEDFITVATKGNSLVLTGRYAQGKIDETIPIKGSNGDAAAKFSAGSIARGLSQADGFTLSKRDLVLFGGDNFVYVVSALGA